MLLRRESVTVIRCKESGHHNSLLIFLESALSGQSFSSQWAIRNQVTVSSRLNYDLKFRNK